MTRNYFDKELQELNLDMLKMCTIVEEALNNSVKAMVKQDTSLAQSVIDGDDEIDEMEHAIEDKCIKLIALQAPMAKDLRFIAIAMKIITDLERIADHAVDIAKITIRLADVVYIKELIDIPRMGEITSRMVKESIDAYVKQDVEKAREVAKLDDEVDALNKQIFNELLLLMMEDPKKISQSTNFLFVSKSLERIGDYVTNICEKIIYTVTTERSNLNN